MRRLAKQIASRGLTRDDAREVRRQEIGPRITPEVKPYTYKYFSPKKDFNLEIRFRRSEVEPEEIVAALRAAADAVDGNSS